MYELLLIALLAIVPQDCVARDGVDALEVNHLYDDGGRLVFTQVIGWERDDRCRFWRMAKTADMLPAADPIRGGYVLRWIDNDTTREVRAPSIRETWTQYDVETYDRQFLPAELRRKLRGQR
jgi:hypothetical protein